MINLLSIGISSYNFKNHVASDVPTNGYFIESNNLNSQGYLDQISGWTRDNRMELNRKLCIAMLFNFTTNYQVGSKAKIDNDVIDISKETKLLGVMVNDRMNWDS